MAKNEANLMWLWRRRLNHINFKIIETLFKLSFIERLSNTMFIMDKVCLACQEGKQVKFTFKSKKISFNKQTIGICAHEFV